MLRMDLVFIIGLLVGVGYAQNTTPDPAALEDLISSIFNKNDGTATNNQNPFPNPNPNTNIIPSTPVPPFQPLPTKTTVLGPNTNTNNNNNVPIQKYKSCGYQKECVSRFLCRNDTIIQDGTGIIDIRINGAECDYIDVCCDIPNKVDVPIIEPKPKEHHEGCGYQNPEGVGFKIIGAANGESEFGEFPWMVAVLVEESAGEDTLNLYQCGGALIAPNVVMTAAHCVQALTADRLVVRAGEWDTQSQNEILLHQDRHVDKMIVHEQYNKGSLYNDVALLLLREPFKIEENVRPVCLPEANINFDYSRCYATGWGKDKFGKDGEYQVILKKIDLPVVNRQQCEQDLKQTRLGLYFKLHESFMCAGGEKDKDTCKGDGGSPLVCPIAGEKNRFYQAGIVAWGIGCGGENIPGVYASIPYLRPWIDGVLRNYGVDFSYFTP